ncbi:nitrite reductase (NAD(P)H) small subunit [Salipaludibacillus keqinensis]|uniref:Nitrite reductase (NAD(P)H) small subunit n=1 Tax=Salipaludibacillus keqinensis TaxID=2045207 RepID=A0A323TL31_9BACI|nr:nitrite reductase small subunit NirD [Salipaludibacillus keqinensis]PYZ95340.1 nitrite reductase (NAD(P)H) small subunit [Salipaludibacillus keqinensis]
MKQTLSKQQVKICPLDELPLQVGKKIVINEQEIALFRLQNDTVKAVENKCPHKQGPLSEGMVSGDNVFCPLHDWKINLDTGEVQKPDDGCVKTYLAEVVDNDVYISL